MITAICSKNDKYVKIQETLYQYDYGQKLKIQGLQLPELIEIQFSLNEQGGETITRIGITENTATYVTIPDALLENNDTEQNYNIFAFVYVTEEQSGKTEYKIPIRVKTRPRPEGFKSEEEKYFDETVKKVSEILENTKNIAREAEAWAHGHERYPERDEDNSRYYAVLAADTVAEIPGKVEDAKKEIAEEVKKIEQNIHEKEQNVENLKELAERAEKRAEEQVKLAEKSKNSAAEYATIAKEAASSAAGSADNAAQYLADIETADTLLKKDIETGTTLKETLNQTVKEGTNLKNGLDASNKTANELKKKLDVANEDAGASERLRVSAEEERKDAEENRANAENERVKIESERVENERIRIDAEIARVLAEEKRKEAEEQRVQESAQALVDVREQMELMYSQVTSKNLVVNTYTNAKELKIGSRETDIIKISWSAFENTTAIFLATIPIEMSADGNLILTYYKGFETVGTLTKYLQRGLHFVTATAYISSKAAENVRWIVAAHTEYFESDTRIQNAKIQSFLEYCKKQSIVVNQSGVPQLSEKYKETEIDDTVPSGSILAQQIKAVVFAQGLNSTVGWDGTLGFEEEISGITLQNIAVSNFDESLEIMQDETKEHGIAEKIAGIAFGNIEISAFSASLESE